MIANRDDPIQVVEQLAVRYPGHPRTRIEAVVHRHWRSYDDATVRTFVPVLVTREAAAELRLE